MVGKFLDFVRENYVTSVIAGVLLIVAFVSLLVHSSLPPAEFTIATGRQGGGYYQAALEYQAFAAARGFTVHIRTTAGSVETLDLLRRREVEVGFVQGGTAPLSDAATLSTLASLFYEPLWIFYRVDTTETSPLTLLSQLQGMRIGVSEVGSGAHTLALRLLNDNGVTAQNATFVEGGTDVAAQELINGALDAALMVLSPTAPVVQTLSRHPMIEIMSVANPGAYSSRYPYLTQVVLDQGSFDLAAQSPHERKQLLATVANLVIRNDFHSDTIRLLVFATNAVHQRGGIFEKRYEFPNTLYADLPDNPTALAYQQRLQSGGKPVYDEYLPFWASTMVERYVIFILPALLLLAPILARSPLVFQYRARRSIRRWYSALHKVERDMARYTLPEVEQAIDQMENLQQMLTERIKVGISYMNELYDLHMHVEWVIGRLWKRRETLMTQQGMVLSQDPQDQPEESKLLAA